jgi:hypothetical protein
MDDNNLSYITKLKKKKSLWIRGNHPRGDAKFQTVRQKIPTYDLAH